MKPVTLWLLLGSCAAAWYMTGVIWTVQLVHYFLFDRVGQANWQTYHALHSQRMTWVVLAPMVVELGASCLLVLLPPAPLDNTGRGLLWLGAICAVLTWAVTFFISVPLHGKLSHGFDANACHALLQTNWGRTVLWSLHALCLVDVLRRLLTVTVAR